MSLEQFTQDLNYRFNKSALLLAALTHRSHSAEHNERLEFLGDGVLDCVIARLLYEGHAQWTEGELSRARAYLVKEEQLAILAQRLRLGELIRIGDGEEKSGGRERQSMLADSMEAIFGAIWMDGGFNAVEQVITHLYAPLLAVYDPNIHGKDAKTRLQEWLQARGQPVPLYTSTAHGHAHEQEFEVECRITGLNITTRGRANSKRAAEQLAAGLALATVEQHP